MTDVSRHFYGGLPEMPWKKHQEGEMTIRNTDFDFDDENLDDVPDEDVSWEQLEDKELDWIYKDDDDEFPRSS